MLVDLGWVDFEVGVPPSCPAVQPLLPNSPSAKAELGGQWITQNSSQPNQVQEMKVKLTDLDEVGDDSYVVEGQAPEMTIAETAAVDYNRDAGDLRLGLEGNYREYLVDDGETLQ